MLTIISPITKSLIKYENMLCNKIQRIYEKEHKKIVLENTYRENWHCHGMNLRNDVI